MEHSLEPSIIKTLIDYSEYERLKHIEQKYNELKNSHNSSQEHHTSQELAKPASKHSLPEQIGGSEFANANYTFDKSTTYPIHSISTIVPQTLEVETDQALVKNVQSFPFNSQIQKGAENTIYDDKVLLHLIPKNAQHRASLFLKEINNRGNELTYNSSGTVFIDQVSIPGSNFYLIFPYLFKTKTHSKLEGFLEVIQKIRDMGLESLISKRHVKSTPCSVVKPSQAIETIQSTSLANTKNIPWWYIGD